ncbi:peroxiredoxin-like family protein [Pseudomarimonas salicorniae]|uniref:thioredoxin-dependent peroxiredoxin n=1 Tax=Pseudomarimonas salicorniae TaxID=2933270 RepID=A0ABT0GHM2_9GAMM|nr:peroxiredoxin-like family protein [Lysobacter sp. CAU 1642]MCK7593520.1 AhpC/TSA family protein [Lysobacter sp. CAU 1642]
MFRSLCAAALLLAAAASNAADFPTDPQAVQPPLLGTPLPEAQLRTVDGEPVSIGAVRDGRPAVIVFYRGGWCPYCNLQLSQLRTVIEPLKALGYQMIAVSPDSPASLSATLQKEPLPYTLLSDSELSLIAALGIGFRVDPETLEKYRGYGIDLEAASGGQTHYVLPVPAVFVVDAAGIIQFHYVNPDYRIRVPGALILEAARSLKEIKPLR